MNKSLLGLIFLNPVLIFCLSVGLVSEETEVKNIESSDEPLSKHKTKLLN